MTPNRIQPVAEVGLSNTSIILAAFWAAIGGLVEHYVGYITPLLLVVCFLWSLDMVGGTIRAMVTGWKDAAAEWERGVANGTEKRERPRRFRGAVKRFRWLKTGEGLGKILAVALWVSVAGAIELEGTFPFPIVGVGLGFALGLFGVSVLDQVNFFWPQLGDKVRGLMARGEQEGSADRRADEVTSRGG